MHRSLLIGLGAGLVSAFLALSASAGPLVTRILIAILSLLPIALAGLGAGALSAAMAAVVSGGALLLMLGPGPDALKAFGQGATVASLCHLALLNREVPAGPFASSPAVEWYPPGRIVAAGTLLAGVLGYLTTMVLGPSLDDQRKLLRKLLDLFFERMPQLQARPLDEEQFASLVEMMLYALPAAAALSTLLILLLNLYLGARITSASGYLARPLPDVPAMAYPAGFGLAFAAALAATFIGGTLGFVASGFAGAFFCALVLLGLAIIHDISRGIAGRPVLLVVLYGALVVLNSWVALALAVFALLSPVLPLKRGNPPPPPVPD